MTVRFRPWASHPLIAGRLALRTLLLPLLASVAVQAGDGMKYENHWYRLGLSAQDVDLIDQLNMSKKDVERLVMHGVSVREYARRPWEAMGITEEAWKRQLDNGNDIASLERRYDRSRDVQDDDDSPSLALAFFAPGVVQIGEDRPVLGWGMLTGAVALAGFTVKSTFIDKQSSLTLPILLGAVMTTSAADVWWRHQSEQARTGFAWAILPGTDNVAFAIAGSF
ncbi:MAG: hypothetical protein H6686_11640 [Fibrobacteria bacterium]|nr:hypothetical protein [Fibrobacteria bacterium]